MRRWVFKIAAGVSLLLSLALVAARLNGRVAGVYFCWTNNHQDASATYDHALVLILGSCVYFIRETSSFSPPGPMEKGKCWVEIIGPFQVAGESDLSGHWFLGFARNTKHNEGGYNTQDGPYHSESTRSATAIPYWFLIMVTGALPLWWSWRRRRDAVRKRRRKFGLCLTCGYDLRATTDRCPECATPVPAGHVAKVTP